MIKKYDFVYGCNAKNKPIEVRHQDLEPDSDESLFRSECPICSRGVLLVRRDQKTFHLSSWDNCISCGQQFIYTDFENSGEVEILNRRKEKHMSPDT